MQAILKRCVTCKIRKAYNEFNKNKRKKDGLDNRCRYCSCKARRENKPQTCQKCCVSKRRCEFYKDDTACRVCYLSIGLVKCSLCKELKSTKDFSDSKRARCITGKHSRCKTCECIRAKSTKNINNDRRRQRRFGLQIGKYDALLDKQNNMCAICNKPEILQCSDGTIQALQADHDHKTNKIRGLLCSRCNRGLGHFKDDPNLIKTALDYLLSYS